MANAARIRRKIRTCLKPDNVITDQSISMARLPTQERLPLRVVQCPTNGGLNSSEPLCERALSLKKRSRLLEMKHASSHIWDRLMDLEKPADVRVEGTSATMRESPPKESTPYGRFAATVWGKFCAKTAEIGALLQTISLETLFLKLAAPAKCYSLLRESEAHDEHNRGPTTLGVRGSTSGRGTHDTRS